MLRRPITGPGTGAGRYGLAWRLAQPRVQNALRAARAGQLRARMAVWQVHLDRLQAGLEAWDAQRSEPASLQIYNAVSPPPATAPPQRTRPPAPLLYQIFEGLRPGQDLEESGYPRMEVVEAELQARNIASADPRYVEAAFANWRSGRIEPSPPATQPGRLPPPGREMLYEIFQDLDLDDPAEMNRLGLPRVAAVNRRLPVGYADADPDEIADAFAEWCDLAEDASAEPERGHLDFGNVYEVFPGAAQRP